MQRFVLNPEDRRIFNRWLRITAAVYASITLIVVLTAASSPNMHDGTALQARANSNDFASTVNATR
jgi:hypothetical protein